MQLKFLNYQHDSFLFEPFLWGATFFLSVFLIWSPEQIVKKIHLSIKILWCVFFVYFSWRFYYELFSSRISLERAIFDFIKWLLLLLTIYFISGKTTSIRKRAGCVALLMGTLWGVEGLFANFVKASDFNGFTFGSRKWYKKYWVPINKEGYRDFQYESDDLEDKKILFAAGDSFAAGAGIKHVDNRVSNILSDHLGENWVVLNRGVLGGNIETAISSISNGPVKPDIVLLSYYVNDIEPAAAKAGVPFEFTFQPPGFGLRIFVESFHLVNFIYWKWNYYKNIRTSYLNDMQNRFDDLRVWNIHKEELNRLVQYIQENKIELFVVIYPHLADVAESSKMTAKIKEYFDRKGIYAMDLAPILIDREPISMIVSRSDPHPNKSLNKEVASLIFSELGDLGIN